MKAIHQQTVHEIAQQVRAREVSAVEVTKHTLERIGRLDAQINSYIDVLRDDALEQARVIDARLARGEHAGALAGVPIAVKDTIATAFGRTTCASKFLEGYRSPFSATAVKKLMDAGAIIVGKTNCDEFAMGSTTEHSAFGPTRNPWDRERVPGGSSGGSAAAVSAGLCAAALGSDTGGSVRQPAAFCGVVGLKPSYGRISRYGLVAFGSSLDQIGPMTNSVADAALMLEVMAGADVHDATTSDAQMSSVLNELERPIEKLRVGVPRQYREAGNHAAVQSAFERAIKDYERMGARIVDVDLSLTDHGISTYYVIATAEASSNLARFDGIRFGRRAKLQAGDELFDLYARSRAEGFGAEVQRRILLGTYVLSAGYYDAYYRRALQVRRLIRQEYDAAFKQCDVLLGPTAPTPAFAIGSRPDPLSMYLGDVYTVNANIAGVCAISLPVGVADVEGVKLPQAVQLQGPAFAEAQLLRASRMLERVHEREAMVAAGFA